MLQIKESKEVNGQVTTVYVINKKSKPKTEPKTKQNEIESLVKPNDIFYTSWGYDQTNYDFLKVLSISKTGKTAKCQMVHANITGNSSSCDHLKPTEETYGDIFNMRIQKGYYSNPVLRGSYPFCYTGKMENSRLDTFNLSDKKSTYAQTDAYHGH